MTKPKNTSMLTCEICDFKVTNSYIFKRHLHRCLSLHGIASKHSSPRHPVRLKGTEGLLNKDNGNTDIENLDLQKDVERSESIISSTKCSDENEDMEIEKDAETKMDSKPDADSSGSNGSQWGVTDSGEVILSESNETEKSDSTEMIKPDKMLQRNSSLPLPEAPRTRWYKCEHCPFESHVSRDYLYHLRDEHHQRVYVYECDLCDYASRYPRKLERHMAVHNKADVYVSRLRDKKAAQTASERLTSDDSKEGDCFTESELLKVKPLKLKRLNIKTPSLFKISGSSKHGEKRQHRVVRKSSKPREVVKMVLSEDGSEYYQCRDCRYYSQTPSQVRKHHEVCHNKLLPCPHCEFLTTGQAELYEHLMIHSNRYMYSKCEDCSYVTNAKSNYEKHRSFHGADLPHKCSICNFAADSESKIKRHVATQHRNASSVEEIVDESYIPEEGVDTDINDGWDDVTTEDNERDSNASSSATIMVDDNEQISGERNDKPKAFSNSKNLGEDTIEYRCPKCTMICYRRGNFTRHLTAKHKYNQISASSLSKSIERQLLRGLKRKFPLSPPGSVMSALKKKRFSMPTENLKCHRCSYYAKWPSDLRRHMQVHTMLKRYKCSLCDNKYKYLGDLNVHMRRDHNVEPPQLSSEEMAASDVVRKASPAVFRCPICPFSAHSKATLEQHSRQHGDLEKTYQCRLCDYQTYWRGDVGRHMFRHHETVINKGNVDIDQFFIHRPEIRPITKMAHSKASLSPSSESIKTEIMDPEFLKEGTPDSTGSSKTSYAGVSLKEGSFVCEYPKCDYKTTTSDRMESHIAIHMNLKQFMCPTCGKRTNWKWDVVKHMNKVHQNPDAAVEDVLTLSLEDAKRTIDDYLSTFEKQKELSIFLCSLCDFKSMEKNRVVRHMGTLHKNCNGKVLSQLMSEYENDSELSQTERRLSMESSSTLEPNEEAVKGKVIEKFVEPPSEELAKYDKPFACAICNKRGTTKGDVKKHYNYTHPYKEVRVIYIVDGTEFNYYTGEIYQKTLKYELEDGMKGTPNLSPSLSPSGKLARPDSKFSNPKMHGYVKPFKCSICGLRSNWKWDLKKHLRAKHPNDGGFVIMLSIEEAQQTYGTECSPSHPKYNDFLSLPTQDIAASESAQPSLSLTPDSLFKQPLTIKSEILDSSDSSPNSSQMFPMHPLIISEKGTIVDPKKRQWKCSACDYITNWRRNMARHIHRRHKHLKNSVTIIPLHDKKSVSRKRSENSLASSLSYAQKTNEINTNGQQNAHRIFITERKSSLPNADSRLWKCSLCSFSSRLRTHIIVHMQKHNQKPFACGVCNLPFMHRGPLHRHIQKTHKRPDYVQLSRLVINYDNEGGLDPPLETQYMDSFFCKMCNFQSVNKSIVVKHLAESHATLDIDGNILKIQKKVTSTLNRPLSQSSMTKRVRNRKIHACPFCPYHSQKKAMLAFHMTYHKPGIGNKFKCKFCPYYVSNIRLLHQHQRKWHSEGSGKLGWEESDTKTPPTSPLKQAGSFTPRRHACEKCPYTTNSKNDFIYHKQFHRPKRTAEYKCEYCDYWVIHKRLLKQHTRLHTGETSPAAGLSTDVSPAKSLYSDPGLVYDPVELTELASLKQKMISAKITASLSKSPTISPMKIASQCSVDNRPTFVNQNGIYRKLHRCRRCPYTNVRHRNLQLHEMMHGPRDSPHPLMKCPYCDYYVGSKGLLSLHMKVHQKSYWDKPEVDPSLESPETEDVEDREMEILPQQKVDTLLQISRFKRFGCEKCPYASAKRQHFERHLELHGSRQRYTCQYCDYSVPSSTLLNQHTKLHLMPNQNLLASQSITNLQHMNEVPADVALASALPPADMDTAVTISVIHDHLGLYENSVCDPEPKKLYRCDRCPYANIRRDYLLSHLKFHMVTSALICPYCDYSAPKQALLTQHIRVHFCPLPELSEWLLENGQTERETSQRHLDLAEALKVAHEYQNQSKKKNKNKNGTSSGEKGGLKEEKPEGKENIQEKPESTTPIAYICQYCDREFGASEKLVQHELQHLIGNNFERTEYMLRNKQIIEKASVKALSDPPAQEKEKEPEMTGKEESTTEAETQREGDNESCKPKQVKEKPAVDIVSDMKTEEKVNDVVSKEKDKEGSTEKEAEGHSDQNECKEKDLDLVEKEQEEENNKEIKERKENDKKEKEVGDNECQEKDDKLEEKESNSEKQMDKEEEKCDENKEKEEQCEENKEKEEEKNDLCEEKEESKQSEEKTKTREEKEKSKISEEKEENSHMKEECKKGNKEYETNETTDEQIKKDDLSDEEMSEEKKCEESVQSSADIEEKGMDERSNDCDQKLEPEKVPVDIQNGNDQESEEVLSENNEEDAEEKSESNNTGKNSDEEPIISTSKSSEAEPVDTEKAGEVNSESMLTESDMGAGSSLPALSSNDEGSKTLGENGNTEAAVEEEPMEVDKND